jgi:hypothetical protein
LPKFWLLTFLPLLLWPRIEAGTGEGQRPKKLSKHIRKVGQKIKNILMLGAL